MAQFTIVLPDQMAEEVTKEAERNMVSKSAVVRWALEQYQKNRQETRNDTEQS